MGNSNVEYHEIPCSGVPKISVRLDRQTNTTKLIIVVSLRDFANSPQNPVTSPLSLSLFFFFKVSCQTMASMRNSELVNSLRKNGAVVERIIM